ncbi:toxin co-regulated pilus biosynthesis Q family protein [Sulfitobacter sp. R18_1]|uniref:toxin co-regulated pilus biosynthesis Q family protein n=1 Tax=Sulfitobacter sp. R18_1 TaxID=2821104 RepID=UPI001ADA812C|nr:toxin co-regulated pilus biosynthesis Q family protein [Sulfitobacter sp. R18_1]MBO9428542.1 toxin co-regulated pilus biosynthesis Q family protein [Sulfitobacter sp. R18_1]
MKLRKILLCTAASIMTVASASSAEEAKLTGFGNGIPLNYAVEQIVPERFNISYGTGVKVDSLVSWKGGDEWRVVLNDMLSEKGLFADFSATDKLRITNDVSARPVRSSGLQVAEYEAAKPGPRKGSYADDLRGDRPGLVFPDDIVAAEEPEEVVSGPEGFEVLEYSHRPQSRPEDMGENSILVGIDPEDFLPAGETWLIMEGSTLEDTLMTWASRAGWTLVWNSEHGYPLEASAEFQGSFVDVSARLIKAMSRVKHPPEGEFFKGNKVLVVTSVSPGNG